MPSEPSTHSSTDFERLIVLTTDDATEAWNELQRRRASGERGWDMAVVQWMPEPPRTSSRFCVYRELRRG